MKIGIPKEIKDKEYTVAVITDGAYELLKLGNEVISQNSAGIGSGYSDKEYVKLGCVIKKDIEEVYSQSELIVKVKEPIEKEYGLIREDHIIFKYIHLFSNKKLAEALLRSGSACIAYETIEKDGKYPLLAPMSEIAGREAVIVGTYYLGIQFSKRGLLLEVFQEYTG